MLYEVKYRDIGFNDEEWETITKGDRRVIRDYILNNYDDTETSMYSFYEDERHVQRVRNEYKLNERPKIIVTSADIHIQDCA